MVAFAQNDKRKYLRHPFGLPLKLDMPKTESPAVAESQDISQGGLSFLWKSELNRGTRLEITIPVKSKHFHIAGRVAYSRPDTVYPRLYRTGVRFTDTDSAFKAKLAEETLEILSYQKRLSREVGHEVPVDEAARVWIRRYAACFASYAGGR